MAIILFANNATSTLQNAIGSSALSLTLAPGGGAKFPSPSAGQIFLFTLVDAATGLLNEICQCTARSGDTLTIVRAQEGTAAQNWNSGDFVNMYWTAGAAAAMLQQGQQQQQSTNYAVDTGTVNAMAVTLSPVPTSMTQLVGAPIRVKIANTNTAATPTLNVNALGAQNCNIVNAAGVQPIGVGTLPVGAIATFIWDGTRFTFQGIVAPATTAQIIAGSDNVQPITSAGLRAAEPAAASTTQGYKQFADGTIIQWGQVTTSSGTGEDFFLPIAFPTAAVSLTCTGRLTTSGSWLSAISARFNAGTPLTKITVYSGALNASVPPPAAVICNFIAIGY